jgi:hypothetical protein
VKKCINNVAKIEQKGNTPTQTLNLYIAYLSEFKKGEEDDHLQGHRNFIFVDTFFITTVNYSTYPIVCPLLQRYASTTITSTSPKLYGFLHFLLYWAIHATRFGGMFIGDWIEIGVGNLRKSPLHQKR